MTAVQGRNTRRIQAIKANMRAARLQPCRRCGQKIDYDAAPGDPDAFNAGHIKPWSTHPELREDPGNYQPEHETCNKSAGNRDEKPGLGLRSREW
jgi:hypothetical protein